MVRGSLKLFWRRTANEHIYRREELTMGERAVMDETIFKTPDPCRSVSASHPCPLSFHPDPIHPGSDIAFQLYIDGDGVCRLLVSACIVDVSDFYLLGILLWMVVE